MEKNDKRWSSIKICLTLKNKNGGRSSWIEEALEKEKKVGEKEIKEIERKNHKDNR